MSDVTYIVKPMSASDIELDVARFLYKYQKETLFGHMPLNAEKLLDDIFTDKGYCLEITFDNEFHTGILGETRIGNRTIQIRESDFMKCDSNGFARMNIAHEVAHPRLHSEFFEQNPCRLYRVQGNRLPAYMSSEWQASVWGSCCLMPFPAVVKVITEGENSGFSKQQIISCIKQKFIVSKSAANVRYSTINNYRKKGSYNEIAQRIEKEIYR
jgi:hypothetical protein